jgi:hypothetical protein
MFCIPEITKKVSTLDDIIGKGSLDNHSFHKILSAISLISKIEIPFFGLDKSLKLVFILSQFFL